MKKNRFPGFKKCMAMMRKHDSVTQEVGFHYLLARASEHVPELIEEFKKELDPGLKCWLLELIGSAKSPEAFDLFAGHLRSTDESLRRWAIRGLKNLATVEARTLLWKARSFKLDTPADTVSFRNDLDAF
jgi:HEAT repeats